MSSPQNLFTSGLRNAVSHGRAVSEEDYAFLVELRTWLIDGELRNDL